uniref:Fibrinogen alpha/beta/gamma chain coiled coil domain-containing protein n=1 Tax=Periophthalmus magnuspinnatus TaxID=409849 RepID=A0A3B3ZQX0_9GOBI
ALSLPTVCLTLSQNGRQSLSRTDRKKSHCGGGRGGRGGRGGGRGRGGGETHLPLCADEDWVSRCPSGCRVQGLILDHETKVENKLRRICKTVKTYKDEAEKTMATTARTYHRLRERLESATGTNADRPRLNQTDPD